MQKLSKGRTTTQLVSLNLGNKPTTKKQMKELPLGIHVHPYGNRRSRRDFEQDRKPGNNRKVTDGRLLRKQFINTNKGIKVVLHENKVKPEEKIEDVSND